MTSTTKSRDRHAGNMRKRGLLKPAKMPPCRVCGVARRGAPPLSMRADDGRCLKCWLEGGDHG